MKVALVGSRTFANAKIVEAVIRRLLERDPDVVIVSGGARGADTLAEQAARRLCRHPPLIFPADWRRHGMPMAAFIRNQQIVEVSDEVVAFWDGRSTGTSDTVRRAFAAQKPVFVFRASDKKWLRDPRRIPAFTRPVRPTQLSS